MAAPGAVSNCAKYLLNDVNENDYSKCVQCRPGYIATKNGCSLVPTA